jgi:hypothetical protein
MNRRAAFPFSVIPDDAIYFAGWIIGDPGQPLVEATDILDRWDYARDLQVLTTVDIDWVAVARTLNLAIDDLRLNISLIVGTGSGRLPRNQERLFRKVIQSGTGPFEVSSIISGSRLSGRLRLHLQVTLEAPLNSGSALSPKARGARLWEDIHDILIEDGGDSRFPIETVSFSDVFNGKPQRYSPWYLHWRPGALRSDFSGTVRLYVNTDFPEIAERFVRGDISTLQAIMGDVISQMMEFVLNNQDTDELTDCDVGSVGSQIRKWLDLAFPGKELNAIKALRTVSPGEYRAAILASVEFEAYE